MESFNLYLLPEDCFAMILSLTSPGDVCRLSSVSSMFQLTGNSSAVWRKFLPPDYESIIARSNNPSQLLDLPLKKIYSSLCMYPILIDNGYKSFWLNRLTGKKCYMLSARALTIVWGSTPMYWKWTSIYHPRSRFSEVARLRNVCWLEIKGKIDVKALSPSTHYAAYFVFTLERSAYGLKNQPVKVTMGLAGSGESITRVVYLDVETPERLGNFPQEPFLGQPFGDFMVPPILADGGDLECRMDRSDGWWEVKIGEFKVDLEEGELEMRLTQLGGHWKRGLAVQGIEIRPR
ncbi:hypothetical protein SAY87_025221 [Trapa incisa]|uniref:F-box domain-containing protein n=1 Tax=Trapa incisa TaxID=236973 RepID=A0AAN7GL52_9MYRT|nr:hypothetical protein SAY87_025221 [Trapa incisa]